MLGKKARMILAGGLACALCACAALVPSLAGAHKSSPVRTSAGDAGSVKSIALWMRNAEPVGWTEHPDRVIYNAVGADGMFDAYSANPGGTDVRCLTCAAPSFAGVGAATNRGASDVSPDGRYMLVTVERGDHTGRTGAIWTQPGKGGANDVWLYTTDGTGAWPLTDISAPGQQSFGTIWPRFNHTGDAIVWASMYAPAVLNLGFWQLKVAHLSWAGGSPSLTDTRTIEPAPRSFYEPYGFTPDDSRIIFDSNAGFAGWLNSQIDTIGTDGSGLRSLTTPIAGQANYKEFAFYTPHNSSIVFGSTRDTTSGGLDYWMMNPDGSDQHRLTYFNQPWHSEAMGYSDVLALTFNPRNPSQFLAGVTSDINAQHINAELVTLNPSGARGLTERVFADTHFGQLRWKTAQNPSDGFDADGAPAPGVPSGAYSIRWSGKLLPPASGRYTLCIVANPSGRLLVRGKLLVDVSSSPGRARCSRLKLRRGATIPIRFDYVHSAGPAYAQLSWAPPGASRATVIPSTDLRP